MVILKIKPLHSNHSSVELHTIVIQILSVFHFICHVTAKRKFPRMAAATLVKGDKFVQKENNVLSGGPISTIRVNLKDNKGINLSCKTKYFKLSVMLVTVLLAHRSA